MMFWYHLLDIIWSIPVYFNRPFQRDPCNSNIKRFEHMRCRHEFAKFRVYHQLLQTVHSFEVLYNWWSTPAKPSVILASPRNSNFLNSNKNAIKEHSRCFWIIFFMKNIDFAPGTQNWGGGAKGGNAPHQRLLFSKLAPHTIGGWGQDVGPKLPKIRRRRRLLRKFSPLFSSFYP